MARPSRREVADAIATLQAEHLSLHDERVRLLCRAAEVQELRTLIMDLCPDLRPEYHRNLEHENPGIEAVRKVLWSPECVPAHKLGCKVERRGVHLGFSQRAWRRQASFITGCVDHSPEADEEVLRALGQLDNISDPRTGTPTLPVSQRSRLHPDLKHMVKGIVLYTTNVQVSKLRALKDAQTDHEKKEMLQGPVDAIEKFCDRFRGLTTSAAAGGLSQAVSGSLKRKHISDDDSTTSQAFGQKRVRVDTHEDRTDKSQKYQNMDDEGMDDREIPDSEDERMGL